MNGGWVVDGWWVDGGWMVDGWWMDGARGGRAGRTGGRTDGRADGRTGPSKTALERSWWAVAVAVVGWCLAGQPGAQEDRMERGDWMGCVKQPPACERARASVTYTVRAPRYGTVLLEPQPSSTPNKLVTPPPSPTVLQPSCSPFLLPFQADGEKAITPGHPGQTLAYEPAGEGQVSRGERERRGGEGRGGEGRREGGGGGEIGRAHV